MDRIASFSVDHTILRPGLYRSRQDKHITTYDLRFVRPNTESVLSNAQLHSVEHLIATLLRNGPKKEYIIYFGPMGCQTGFYLLVDGDALDGGAVLTLLRQTFAQAADYDGGMPGASEKECGNWRNLSLDCARAACAAYGTVLEGITERDMIYPHET